MINKKNTIRFDKFIVNNNYKKDIYTAVGFIFAFLIISMFESNLFLPGDSFGLLEHINIWFLLGVNIILPFALNRLFMRLKNNIDEQTFNMIEKNFLDFTCTPLVKIIQIIVVSVGFCFFLGNTLQNAHIINILPFDYWDSINYILSYILSRIYKLYLYANFIPTVLIYIIATIKSLSEVIAINEKEMDEYPLKRYLQLNSLCDFGINIVIIVIIPFIIISGGVYWVHNRVDVTSFSTIIISIICLVFSTSMYFMLIHEYYKTIFRYKNKQIEKINCELSTIHKYIIEYQFSENSTKVLEAYLGREKYLYDSKKRIEEISKFPLIVKAFITSISPTLPILLKIVLPYLKSFFNI